MCTYRAHKCAGSTGTCMSMSCLSSPYLHFSLTTLICRSCFSVLHHVSDTSMLSTGYFLLCYSAALHCTCIGHSASVGLVQLCMNLSCYVAFYLISNIYLHFILFRAQGMRDDEMFHFTVPLVAVSPPPPSHLPAATRTALLHLLLIHSFRHHTPSEFCFSTAVPIALPYLREIPRYVPMCGDVMKLYMGSFL